MADAFVRTTPHLAADRAAEISPRWLVGASAHLQWRRLLERAVEAGELALLHFDSNLPIQSSTERNATSVANSASNAPAWTVNKPQRYGGYAMPLYRLLADAHRGGNRCPTPHDVVEAWRNNVPIEIAKVLPNGFDYYDANGNTKTADLNAIRKAIRRMTGARQSRYTTRARMRPKDYGDTVPYSPPLMLPWRSRAMATAGSGR